MMNLAIISLICLSWQKQVMQCGNAWNGYLPTQLCDVHELSLIAAVVISQHETKALHSVVTHNTVMYVTFSKKLILGTWEEHYCKKLTLKDFVLFQLDLKVQKRYKRNKLQLDVIILCLSACLSHTHTHIRGHTHTQTHHNIQIYTQQCSCLPYFFYYHSLF